MPGWGQLQLKHGCVVKGRKRQSSACSVLLRTRNCGHLTALAAGPVNLENRNPDSAFGMLLFLSRGTLPQL